MLRDCPALDQWHREVPRKARLPAVMGLAVLFTWICGFGIWAATAPLDGAVIASGAFVASGQNKPVQHLEGGIIRELLVSEGALVEAGQPLVRMDETAPTARYRRLQQRLHRLQIMQARLEAEMQGHSDFRFPASLENLATDPDVRGLFERQLIELRVRRERQADEREVLRKEIGGWQERIAGYNAQLKATQQRVTLFADELKDKMSLLDRQLARKTDVMALQRAEAGLSGEIGDLTGRIADARERIARAEQQIAQLRSAAVQKVAEELRATESELDDVREQAYSARDVLDRTEIRAPARGVIIKLNHHSVGAVVAPGAIIGELLPISDELIIEARVAPGDIAHVETGQEALIRLTAFNQRITPMIGGKVAYVSADTIREEDTPTTLPTPVQRRHSYVARVRLDPDDARAKAPDLRPLPGMPADVYIKTGERTFFSYILRPLLDSFSRAFREH